jgi:hypothetical protein
MKKFWLQVFTDHGEGSFSRVATTVTLAFCLFWTTYLVMVNRALPDFGGMSIFLGILYGVNKAATVATAFSSNPDEPVKPAPPAPTDVKSQ